MKNVAERMGITVIICCYNSAGRIRQTLYALANQECNADLFWEILLVDNASTDDTANFALSVWKSINTKTELRIVHEPTPGVGHARRTGIKHSACPFILFCDDDNWLQPFYVQQMFNILANDPSIAACGGKGIPVFEVSKPEWFDEYQEAFAIGSQEINRENGKILNLYSAGMGVNVKMLKELEIRGFSPVLNGKKGAALNASSEDTELTYALTLMGCRLHYANDLEFFHYLPKERLTFNYLQKLFLAFGNDGPVRNLYYSYISGRLLHKQIKHWHLHMLLAFFRMAKYFILPPKRHGRIIYQQWSIAYIKELYRIMPYYKDIKNNISNLAHRK